MRARLGRPCVVATFRLNDPAMLLPGAHCSPRAAALRICRKVSRWSVWKGVSSMVERLLAGPPGRRRYEREHSRENTHVCCLSAEENQPVSRACLQPWSSSSPPPPLLQVRVFVPMARVGARLPAAENHPRACLLGYAAGVRFLGATLYVTRQRLQGAFRWDEITA
jgi:hypothetical protein